MDSDEPINTTPMQHISKPANAALARLREKIANGLGSNVPPECQFCFGTGMEVVPGEGARRCRCQPNQRVLTSLAAIPPRYAGVTLADLKADASRHPQQAVLIQRMKANPGQNYFICGKPDAGKSHFFWALYQQAAIEGRVLFVSKLFDLIEAIKAEMFDSSLPSPLPNLGGERMGIFLEDVNKARPTEFVGERFFNFLDDVYNAKHQLVVTSQLSPADLVKYFENAKAGVTTVDGAALVRRMANQETAIFRMF